MPDTTHDVNLETPKFAIGDIVMTYSRRFSENPVAVKGVVLDCFLMPEHYPPVKYVIAHNSILCIRDDYTMAKELQDIRVHINLDMSNTSSESTHKEHTFDD